jgi:hypothetical protein
LAGLEANATFDTQGMASPDALAEKMLGAKSISTCSPVISGGKASAQ